MDYCSQIYDLNLIKSLSYNNYFRLYVHFKWLIISERNIFMPKKNLICLLLTHLKFIQCSLLGCYDFFNSIYRCMMDLMSFTLKK
jgi:hypothetical protein